jgi:inorganic pyrophosphatase
MGLVNPHGNIIMAYTTKSVASQGCMEYRTFFQRDGQFVSPFHDIPVWVDKAHALANMVVEIPRGANAKLEISRDEPLNPIKQDVKNGKLRYVHDKYPFNYGAFASNLGEPNVEAPRHWRSW